MKTKKKVESKTVSMRTYKRLLANYENLEKKTIECINKGHEIATLLEATKFESETRGHQIARLGQMVSDEKNKVIHLEIITEHQRNLLEKATVNLERERKVVDFMMEVANDR